MVSYVFPGQGAQKLGMGEMLFKKFPRLVSIANEILGYSIEELCLTGGARINQTEFTQPVLFVVNTLAYLEHHYETGNKPEYLAGHSLGEYNALHIANVFDFSTGVMLVKERGRLMSKAANGGMAAIVGLPLDDVKGILSKASAADVQIANINSPTQIVISGGQETLSSLKAHFDNAGAKLYSVLNVSGAFHSDHMKSAAKEYEAYIKKFSFSAPSVPVIANVTALPYSENQVDIKDKLVSQIFSPVLWSQTISYILKNSDSKVLIEISSGKQILTKLTEQVRLDISV